MSDFSARIPLEEMVRPHNLVSSAHTSNKPPIRLGWIQVGIFITAATASAMIGFSLMSDGQPANAKVSAPAEIIEKTATHSSVSKTATAIPPNPKTYPKETRHAKPSATLIHVD